MFLLRKRMVYALCCCLAKRQYAMLPNFPDKIKSKKKKFERVKMNLIFFFKI